MNDQRCGTCTHFAPHRDQGECVWHPGIAPPWLMDLTQHVNPDDGANCKAWEISS